MFKRYFNILYNKIADRIRQLSVVKRHPSTKEVIKYSIVGNFSNFIDLALYIFLTRAFHFWYDKYLLANALTIIIGSATRFFFHKKWTFRHDGGSFRRQYLRFIFVLVFSLIFNEILLFLIVEYLSVNDVLAKLITMGATTLVVYYTTKVWVFKKDNPFQRSEESVIKF